jgi:hypothetical protein
MKHAIVRATLALVPTQSGPHDAPLEAQDIRARKEFAWTKKFNPK